MHLVIPASAPVERYKKTELDNTLIRQLFNIIIKNGLPSPHKSRQAFNLHFSTSYNCVSPLCALRLFTGHPALANSSIKADYFSNLP